MPIPSSRMRTIASLPADPPEIQIWPLGSVYLAALVTRFPIICAVRTGSASISTGSFGSESTTWCPNDSIALVTFRPLE